MNSRILAGRLRAGKFIFPARNLPAHSWFVTGHRIASGALLVGCLLLGAIVCGCRTAVSNAKVSSDPTIVAQSTSSYDQEIIAAIQKRWYALLGGRPTPRGKVVIEFRSHSDGTVDAIKVVDSDVGSLFEIFCQKAIEDVSPFRPWPQELKDKVSPDIRNVRFTFYYN